ncbi:MAG: SprT-like domain-containing protein [Chitinophagales bacterium]
MENKNAYNIFYEGLKNYLPSKSLHLIALLLAKHHVSLKITPKRSTKLGDYRPPFGKKGHRISINGDLNQYAFLNTLIHELAHLVTYEQYAQTVKSHGIEWKQNYQSLIRDFLNKDIFPTDLEKEIDNYMQNPSASSCNNPDLFLAFRKYNKKKSNTDDFWITKLVEELEDGEKFVSKNKVFVKENKLRKWYKCTEIATGKIFRFHPSAEVFVSEKEWLNEWTQKMMQKNETQVEKPKIALKDLPKDSLFKIKKRFFVKGRKLRTRYECKETITGSLYTVGANYMVEVVSENGN